MKLKFAHLSDSHLVGANADGIICKLAQEYTNPLEFLTEALKALAHESLDFVLYTGDIIHEGNSRDYTMLKELIGQNLPNIPIVCAMGNHDVRHSFRQGFLGEAPLNEPYLQCFTYYKEGKTLKIIVLDTAFDQGIVGTLPPEQLEYLNDALSIPSDMTFLLSHHPIGDVTFGVLPPEGFVGICRGRVDAMFCGHTHRSECGYLENIPRFTAPSLAFSIDISENQSVYTTQTAYNLCQSDDNNKVSVSYKHLSPYVPVVQRKPL